MGTFDLVMNIQGMKATNVHSDDGKSYFSVSK